MIHSDVSYELLELDAIVITMGRLHFLAQPVITDIISTKRLVQLSIHSLFP